MLADQSSDDVIIVIFIFPELIIFDSTFCIRTCNLQYSFYKEEIQIEIDTNWKLQKI